ncbi:SusC/RagA family TonB-linked outer membrane protein [Bacteroidia bacterium]|nr:SusC/RagA family TonB-linked outer membrane protein [Bacteroidia bacterium]
MNNLAYTLKKWGSLLAAVAVCSMAAAQNQTVRGRVADTEGTPMIGVSVVAQGASAGAITDKDGKFSFLAPAAATRIDVSMIGYEPRNVEITKGEMSITLASSSVSLDEMVVIGYGSMRRSDMTGSISSVNINDTEAASAVSVQSLLQGRATGVQVTAGDGAPGSAVNIKIRGTNSLRGNSEPLYVIDGIIMNSVTQNATGGINQQEQNGLTGINPQDIKDIEVLKDASATAIYGALGANGVVLITTKSGTSSKAKVQFTSTVSQSKFVRMRDMLDMNEYIDHWAEAFPSSNPIDPTGLRPINWQKEVTRDALSNTQHLSISGKSDKTKYYISGGYINNNGIVKKTNVEQWNIRMNLDHDAGKFVKIGTKTTFTNTTNNMVQGSDTRGASNSGMIRQMITQRPYTGGGEVLDEEGNDISGGPVTWLRDYRDLSAEYRMVSSLFTDIRFTKWLSMRTTFGVDYRNKTREQWYGLELFTGRKDGATASRGNLEAARYNLDNMFNFNVQKGRHRLNGVAGITMIGSQSKNNPISTSQFEGNVAALEEGFPYGTVDGSPGYSISSFNTFSALGRAIYTYNDKYVATATFRTDGTSKFAPGNKFAHFPSLALAWRFADETAVRNLGLISNGKLRLGWGMVGNSSINPYQTMQTYSTGQYASGNGFVVGQQPSRIANPKLKWETTVAYNAGLDLGLWKNRLNFTVDWYDKTSRDLLQVMNIAISSGYSTMTINRGSMQNRGIEVNFDITPIQTKNTTLTLWGNITRNRNKIMDVGVPAEWFGANYLKAFTGESVGSYVKDYVNIFVEGRPVGLFYGLRSDGIVSSAQVAADRQARIDNYVAANPGTDPTTVTDAQMLTVRGTMPLFETNKMLQAGDPLWYDTNGDGDFNTADRTFLGDPNPDFTFGFGLDFAWKRFTLSAVFNGVYGNEIANVNRMLEDFKEQSSNMSRRAYYGAWRSDESPGNGYPRWNYNSVNNYLNSMVIEDGSFLRCSAVSLGYKWLFKRSSPIAGAGVTITGRNLFVITNYLGYDPEVTSYTNNPMRVGIDWGSYPNSRTFTLGVTLDF